MVRPPSPGANSVLVASTSTFFPDSGHNDGLDATNRAWLSASDSYDDLDTWVPPSLPRSGTAPRFRTARPVSRRRRREGDARAARGRRVGAWVVATTSGGIIDAVQTFLPYPSFERSARALDDVRLGKQRVEVLQILNTLHGLRGGWRHHPAVRMWRGHEEALIEYGLAVTQEWLRRGKQDTCLGKIGAFSRPGRSRTRPPWLGNRALHRSHKSALVRKDPSRYGPMFPGVPGDLPYVWPAPREAEPV